MQITALVWVSLAYVSLSCRIEYHVVVLVLLRSYVRSPRRFVQVIRSARVNLPVKRILPGPNDPVLVFESFPWNNVIFVTTGWL